MKPYYADDTIRLYHGKNLAVLPHLADGSVDCVVTSPPYFGLRSYLPDDHPDKADEYGAEETPAEFVANLVATFREVRRVLADDGTVWLNLGDSYAAKQYSDNRSPAQRAQASTLGPKRNGLGGDNAAHKAVSFTPRTVETGMPMKNILGIPWRTAFALQDDGWILRNAIVWHKPNAMPESVTDRLSTRYEMLFMLSKSRRYWFDLDPIREEVTDRRADEKTWSERKAAGELTGANRGPSRIGTPGAFAGGTMTPNPLGRNPGDVWTIPTTPFPGAHFAAYPPELVRRCIVAGCKPGGTILDPFHGSGTTGMVAQKHGRKYVGIELNQEYLDLSLETRLRDGALPFESDAS